MKIFKIWKCSRPFLKCKNFHEEKKHWNPTGGKVQSNQRWHFVKTYRWQSTASHKYICRRCRRQTKKPRIYAWICKHSKFSTEALSSCWSTPAVLILVLYFLGCRWTLVTKFRLFVAIKKPYLRPSFPLGQGCQCNILTNQVSYFGFLLFWNPFGPTFNPVITFIKCVTRCKALFSPKEDLIFVFLIEKVGF